MWIFLFETINICEKLQKKKKIRMSLNPDNFTTGLCTSLPLVVIHC